MHCAYSKILDANSEYCCLLENIYLLEISTFSYLGSSKSVDQNNVDPFSIKKEKCILCVLLYKNSCISLGLEWWVDQTVSNDMPMSVQSETKVL